MELLFMSLFGQASTGALHVPGKAAPFAEIAPLTFSREVRLGWIF